MQYWNTLDILAAKASVPHLYLTDNQARSILNAVSETIVKRATDKIQKDTFVIVAALVNERGGTVRIPAKVLHEVGQETLTRFDHPSGDIVFTTNSEGLDNGE